MREYVGAEHTSAQCEEYEFMVIVAEVEDAHLLQAKSNFSRSSAGAMVSNG